MFPIYQLAGKGYSQDDFLKRLHEIVEDHRAQGATSVAFIFYDFNSPLRAILRDRDAFTTLDRLTGKELSVFFLDSGGRDQGQRFQEIMQARLGVDLPPPCIVFARLTSCGLKEVEGARILHADCINGLHEIVEILESRLNHRRAYSGAPPSSAPGGRGPLAGSEAVEVARQAGHHLPATGRDGPTATARGQIWRDGARFVATEAVRALVEALGNLLLR